VLGAKKIVETRCFASLTCNLTCMVWDVILRVSNMQFDVRGFRREASRLYHLPFLELKAHKGTFLVCPRSFKCMCVAIHIIPRRRPGYIFKHVIKIGDAVKPAAIGNGGDAV
jgi:hypothetical protein